MKIFLLLALSLPVAFASTENLALSMVPRGKVIERFGVDYIIKTSAGTKVHVEFKRDGKFQEASGRNLNQGDELEPGDGLISLSSIAHKLSADGLKPKGIWTLEEDEQMGWIYDLGGNLVSAKTGEVVRKLSVIELPEMKTNQ